MPREEKIVHGSYAHYSCDVGVLVQRDCGSCTRGELHRNETNNCSGLSARALSFLACTHAMPYGIRNFDLHCIHDIIKARVPQSNKIQLFSKKKCLRRESNPRHNALLIGKCSTNRAIIIYCGSFAGWGQITHTKQHNSRQSIFQPEKQASSNLV